jgi:hypothetical protein
MKAFVERLDVSPWDPTHQVCLFASHICRLVSSTVMEGKGECLKEVFLLCGRVVDAFGEECRFCR